MYWTFYNLQIQRNHIVEQVKFVLVIVTQKSSLLLMVSCRGAIWKGDKLIDGVLETLDMLHAMASSVSTTLHLLHDFFYGPAILHFHAHM
jgi:hypothetical protein